MKTTSALKEAKKANAEALKAIDKLREEIFKKEASATRAMERTVLRLRELKDLADSIISLQALTIASAINARAVAEDQFTVASAAYVDSVNEANALMDGLNEIDPMT